MVVKIFRFNFVEIPNSTLNCLGLIIVYLSYCHPMNDYSICYQASGAVTDYANSLGGYRGHIQLHQPPTVSPTI